MRLEGFMAFSFLQSLYIYEYLVLTGSDFLVCQYIPKKVSCSSHTAVHKFIDLVVIFRLANAIKLMQDLTMLTKCCLF